MSARKGARQLSLAVEEGMLLDCARSLKGRPSTMSPVEFRECFWLEFENCPVYMVAKSTTRAGRTNKVRETVAKFPASDSSPSPKNGARCWRKGRRAGIAGIAKPLLTSLPQPQHNLFPEQPRSLYEEETDGCLCAVGCGDIKICIFVQMTKPEFKYNQTYREGTD